MRGLERLSAVKRSTPAMAEALPDLPMPETVMVRLIRATVAGMGQYFEPVFRAIGLSENSFHVLCLLVATDSGRAAPSELAELVGISRANMTRILDTLESDGLVSRAIEERDARRHAIQITDAGRAMAAAAVPRVAEPLTRAFAGLAPEEFAQLDALLRKAVKSFDQPALPLRASA